MPISDYTQQVHTLSARAFADALPPDSVHCLVTSPPYWQKRDYGVDEAGAGAVVFDGDDDCDHVWTTASVVRRGGTSTDENPPGVAANESTQATGIRGDGVETATCPDCGAWRGQLGHEPTIPAFVSHLADVLDAFTTPLRDDGVVWLNIGDTYDTKGSGLDLGRKQKGCVPERLTIALQERGWIVRNAAVWAKENPMPNPVTDRLNSTTETLLLLTQQPDYWFDLYPIREPHATSTQDRFGAGYDNTSAGGTDKQNRHTSPGNHTVDGINAPGASFDDLHHPAGKNPGNVVEFPTEPFPDAHFAVFPTKLARFGVLAGCPPHVCVACGTPYERLVDTSVTFESGSGRAGTTPSGKHDGRSQTEETYDIRRGPASHTAHIGWEQQCDCATYSTEPGIVIDPFAGAGTTGLVAKRLQRRFVLADILPEYVRLACRRIGLDITDDAAAETDSSDVRDAGQTPLDQFADAPPADQ